MKRITTIFALVAIVVSSLFISSCKSNVITEVIDAAVPRVHAQGEEADPATQTEPASESEETQAYPLGDVNMDGVVDADDMTAMAQHIAKIKLFPGTTMVPLADGTVIGITAAYVDKDGNFYITYSNSATPVLVGNIKGTPGEKGENGANGADGKSAFALYQQAYPDYTGTYTEWLASLKGEKGDKGDTGRGIASMTFNDDNELVITYTDGTTQNMGTIPFTSSVLEYTLLPDDTYGVFAGSGASSMAVIEIPATYNNKAVTQIMANGFKGLSMLQQVNIPDSVTQIGQYAFSECTSLDNVVVPNSVTIIDDYAFYKCTSLKSISLSNTLQTIGAYSFNGCSQLTTIVIPDSVSRIGKYAFYGSSLSDVTMSTTGWKLVGITANDLSFSGKTKVIYDMSEMTVDYNFWTTSGAAIILTQKASAKWSKNAYGSMREGVLYANLYQYDWVKER